MFRICKCIELESGHLLSKHRGNCRYPHGHTRKVEFTFSAPDLDANDMVLDFKLVKEMLGGLVERFDHALCMNSSDPNFAAFRTAYGERVIPFEREDPTSETIARTVYLQAAEALADAVEGRFSLPVRPCVRLDKVRVWETSSSWAEYSPDRKNGRA